MIYFSATKLAFYDSAIHSTLPDDARAIEPATHAALLEAQADGMCIAANDNGDPIAVAQSFAADILLEDLRRRRDHLLTASDWTQMPDAPLDDAARLAWRTYRQQLRDLPGTTLDLTAIEWPVPPA
ncbi:MAG: tail fiber assembly protein [Sphingobium phenoxybenzoativorans]